MIQLLQLLIIASLWIWGVHVIFKPGEIFGSFGDIIRKLPKWLVKPTIGCPACMASIHGTVAYLIGHSYMHEGGFSVVLWFLFIICLAGLNHIIIEHLYDTSEKD
jgi:hypothetical protein